MVARPECLQSTLPRSRLHCSSTGRGNLAKQRAMPLGVAVADPAGHWLVADLPYRAVATKASHKA